MYLVDKLITGHQIRLLLISNASRFVSSYLSLYKKKPFYDWASNLFHSISWPPQKKKQNIKGRIDHVAAMKPFYREKEFLSDQPIDNAGFYANFSDLSDL